MTILIIKNKSRQSLFALNAPPVEQPTFPWRFGYTLVEMMAVISITGALMSMAAIIFQRSTQSYQLAMRALLYHKQIDTFRLQLKRDLAEAHSIDFDGSSRLTLDYTQTAEANDLLRTINDPTMPDRVVYEFDQAGVTRTAYSVQQQVTGSQSWPLSVGYSDVQTDASGAVSLAIINLQILGKQEGSPAREFLWVFRIASENL